MFQCRSKRCLNVKQLGSRWDAELLGISSGSKLFAYGIIVVRSRLRVKPLHAGIQNGRHKKVVCTSLEISFLSIFFKQYSAGGKQAGVTIRAHICGPWSWLQPVCNFLKVLTYQCPEWNWLKPGLQEMNHSGQQVERDWHYQYTFNDTLFFLKQPYCATIH